MGANPNPSPATRFQPGQSGNPGGRPKSRRITEAYNRLLGKPKSELLRITRSRTAPMDEVMAASAILRANGSSDRALVEVTDRVQGKEPQAHELGGLDGERLVDDQKIADRLAELLAKAEKR